MAVALEILKVSNVFEFKSFEEGDRIHVSGYVSTDDEDSSEDIVPVESWDNEYLKLWEQNPLYGYNHTILKEQRGDPIGIVKDWMLDTEGEYGAKGFYFKDAILSETEDVIKRIRPLILDGVLKHHSAGFASYKREKRTGKRGVVHAKNRLMEGSLVTIPDNMKAIVTDVTVKNFNGSYEELETALKAENLLDSIMSGIVQLKGADKERFSIVVGKTLEKEMEVTISKMTLAADQSGAVITVNKDAENYVSVMDSAYLLSTEKEGKKSYHLKLGFPTETGIKYEPKELAISFCKLFGARNLFTVDLTKEQKLEAVNVLAKIYSVLGLKIPVCKFNDTEVHQLPDWQVASLKFRDISFVSNEEKMFRDDQVAKALDSVIVAVKDTECDNEEIKTKALEVTKYIYSSARASLDLYMSLDSVEDAEFILSLSKMIEEYKMRKEASEMEDEIKEAVAEEEAVTKDAELPDIDTSWIHLA